MKRFVLTLIGYFILAFGTSAADSRNWDQWRSLPVQQGGRQKPLDTVGWESLRMIANRAKLMDPETSERLDPTAAYLSMAFDWQGWEHPDKSHLELVKDWRPLYFHLHQADKWDRTPLLRVDFRPLRHALGLGDNQSYVAPQELAVARVKDDRHHREVPFSTWADDLLTLEEANEELSEVERKGLELANRFWSYQNHRMGRGIEILPIKDSDDQSWMSLAQFVLMTFDDFSDPTGDLRRAQESFGKARQSFRAKDSTGFNQHSSQFIALVEKLGNDAGIYPSRIGIQVEVAYNKWSPFRFGWILMLLSALGMFLYWGFGSKKCYRAGVVAYAGALIAVIIGFAMRITISGRPPVTNMYESVLYVGTGVAVFGLVFEWIYPRRYIISAAASVAAVALILADNCPLILDPSLRPLEPVLRSNFWLITHVMTITLSYAALALALGIANITLGHYLFRSGNLQAIGALSRFTYKAIQVGVLLLSAGVILGGVWADYSWGRFWGWDPKEVWALIALLGYLSVLHARFAGWVGHRGLAALSVACFSLVVMAWYGVNFVLGAGLHSYGFGGGGTAYVYSGVALQLIYVAIALLRSSAPIGQTVAAH